MFCFSGFAHHLHAHDYVCRQCHPHTHCANDPQGLLACEHVVMHGDAQPDPTFFLFTCLEETIASTQSTIPTCFML